MSEYLALNPSTPASNLLLTLTSRGSADSTTRTGLFLSPMCKTCQVSWFLLLAQPSPSHFRHQGSESAGRQISFTVSHSNFTHQKTNKKTTHTPAPASSTAGMYTLLPLTCSHSRRCGHQSEGPQLLSVPEQPCGETIVTSMQNSASLERTKEKKKRERLRMMNGGETARNRELLPPPATRSEVTLKFHASLPINMESLVKI